MSWGGRLLYSAMCGPALVSWGPALILCDAKARFSELEGLLPWAP